MSKKITILGAGSWGLAIARLLDQNGARVTLWEINHDDFEKLIEHRTHPDKLPGIKLSESVNFTDDINHALIDCEMLVLAVPSQFVRSVLEKAPMKMIKNIPVINLAKGIENHSLKRMSQVISELTGLDPELVTTLSGPSHAEEVAREMATAVVIAGSNPDILKEIQQIFSSQYFRVYQSTDLIGVELGGSLKNIIAIAAGITAGLNMGDNTMGALITRGLAEISRLGTTLGADPITFAGLSGIGDLITTCMSRHSRNRYVGEHIGMGEKLDDIISGMKMVAEGVATTKSGYALMSEHNVEMPITAEVYEILFNNKPADVALWELMGRKLKSEIWQ